jgi:hypothetical protein
MTLLLESSQRREESLNSPVEVAVGEMKDLHAVRAAIAEGSSPRARSR